MSAMTLKTLAVASGNNRSTATGSLTEEIMSDYKRVPTSQQVWAAIRARHPDLRVFGSYSAPCSDNGDTRKGRMVTSYGLDIGDYPIIEAQTTWDIDNDAPQKRVNERHQYWLCLPKREDA